MNISGEVPGMCFANELELNEEYILFLHHYPGDEHYVQADSALPVSRLNELANVCDLELKLPTGISLYYENLPMYFTGFS